MSIWVGIYDKDNNLIYKSKGINSLAKELGFKYTSSLKRYIDKNKPINTKHKTIYQGYFVKKLGEILP
jgi:hypothetical protein